MILGVSAERPGILNIARKVSLNISAMALMASSSSPFKPFKENLAYKAATVSEARANKIIID